MICTSVPDQRSFLPLATLPTIIGSKWEFEIVRISLSRPELLQRYERQTL